MHIVEETNAPLDEALRQDVLNVRALPSRVFSIELTAMGSTSSI